MVEQSEKKETCSIYIFDFLFETSSDWKREAWICQKSHTQPWGLALSHCQNLHIHNDKCGCGRTHRTPHALYYPQFPMPGHACCSLHAGNSWCTGTTMLAILSSLSQFRVFKKYQLRYLLKRVGCTDALRDFTVVAPISCFRKKSVHRRIACIKSMSSLMQKQTNLAHMIKLALHCLTFAWVEVLHCSLQALNCELGPELWILLMGRPT